MTGKGLIPPEVLERVKTEMPGPKFKLPSQNGKDEVIFVPISRNLYKELVDYAAKSRGEGLPEGDIVEYINERVVDSCVLWPRFTPEEKHLLPIGTIPQISRAIEEKSGFVTITVDGRVIGESATVTQVQDGAFWGDLDEEKKADFKKKYPQFDLFRVRLGRRVFVVRPMSRADLRQAAESPDPALTLVKLVTVWPINPEWNDIPAGVIEHMGDKINDITGFTGAAEVTEL